MATAARSRAISLVLRRMRAPLLVLVGAYAISVLGLVLIPGSDAAGQPQRMDFFHAFYVVTYTVRPSASASSPTLSRMPSVCG